MAIRLVMLYGSECQVVKKQHIEKIDLAEMRMLRWMSYKHLRLNKNFKYLQEVAPIEDKIRETYLGWFGHVQRRPIDTTVKKIGCLEVTGTSTEE